LSLWLDRFALLGRLALNDLWHDRKVSLCVAASLVAVIAPLLLLFGLKHGVVNQLQDDLLRDPRNLEIRLLSSGNYDTAWLTQLQQRPETGFAIGQTRSLNTQADLLGPNRRFVENAEIIPTQAGDPLLDTPLSALRGNQVILSARAAEGLTPGYARARLYARDIDSVAPLERWLNAQHIETSSRLAEIDAVKAINHVLGVIFGVIAGASLVGCIASLIGAFLANIDRKRRSLALLRLLGFQRAAVAGYLVLQALFLSGAGYLGGLACYGVGSQLFNRLLGSSQATGAFVCDITFWHGLTALLLALLVAALVALIGALRAISIEPAESLREL